MPKLILVDGFAGTGKSTAAQRLWLACARAGRAARWFHEHERAHPIFEYREVEDLVRQTPDRFERTLLAGWRAVADGRARGAGARAARKPDDVLIVEGAFLQLPVGVMVAMGASPARVRAMIHRIDDVLAGVDASLVYLSRSNIAAALRAIGGLRGPQWLTAMTATLAATPYGRRHRVVSSRGLVTFYERQRAIVESVLPTLALAPLRINVDRTSWARCNRQVAALAGLGPATEPAMPQRHLLAHAGAYRSASGLPATITTDGRRLYAQLPATRALPLVRVSGGHFVAESLPIDVRFAYDPRGRARRFDYESRMSNEVLADTRWRRV